MPLFSFRTNNADVSECDFLFHIWSEHKGPLVWVFLLVHSVGRCLWWPEKDGLTHFSVMLWQHEVCVCVCVFVYLNLDCFQRLCGSLDGRSMGVAVMSYLARCGPDSKRQWHFANILLLPFSSSNSYCIFMPLHTLWVVFF